MNIEDILFPEITLTPKDIFAQFPPRGEGKVVTRIAPSPTGFLHIGAVYSAMIDKIIASKNDGTFFLRIEDTDQKREVAGAAKAYVEILQKFGLTFDEGPLGENGEDVGRYGPYTQSHREMIYKVFIKDLIKNQKAYPCFLTPEEIENTREIQQSSKMPLGIYKEFSPWRYASIEEIQKALDEGKEYVIRWKSNGEQFKKVEVKDLVKGKITTQENFLDIVICKKNGLPTYHFAHLIDDHLMGTTHVIRGDEWFASLPLHLELFKDMGWDAPEYAHYGPLVKVDGEGKRKLSKRKDPEADVQFYFEQGIFIEAILDFLSNIINAGFEEWRKQNTQKSYLEYDFKLEKINSAGALVDMQKLIFVNSQFINNLSIERLYDEISDYLEKYESEYFKDFFLKASKDYNIKIIQELQKRLTTLKEFKELTSFFYRDFEVKSDIITLLQNPKMKIDDIEIAKKGLEVTLDILNKREKDFESIDEVKDVFIEEIKKAEMKNGQVLWPARVALSGEAFSPGALELIYILGKQKSTQRIQNVLNFL